ncbi:MAG: type II toxin-antitoxin system PemK/MazF family toxin [Gammaproteobacteria bacterium]|nr:type II toxin-antitoxin system PemK/MazF family toxin [Gammaproteobacteria bacterium]
MAMLFKRGAIYLANFNPSKGTEAGKIRPCIVMQSDLLNEANHPSTTVLPLTTQLIDDAAPLRYRIKSRDNLKMDSDIMLDQTRTIDNRRMTNDVLTTLSKVEMMEVDVLWQTVLGLD